MLSVLPAYHSGGWTEISCILISPGFVAWVLTERHDLHIIIAVFLQIGDKDRCQFLIGVPVFLSFAGCIYGTLRAFHKCLLVCRSLLCGFSAICCRQIHNRQEHRSLKQCLDASRYKSIGVCVVHEGAVLTVNSVFIHQVRAYIIYGTFPEIAIMNAVHRSLCPAVELTNYRYSLRCRANVRKVVPPSHT